MAAVTVGRFLSRGTTAAALAAALASSGCSPAEHPGLPTPLPAVRPGTPASMPPQNGALGTLSANGQARVSYGRSGAGVTSPNAQYSGGQGGDISLDFADTDIREAASQILGNLLHANYTIDPGVHGTVTLHTTQPISRDQLVPTLDVLLSQVGATLNHSGSLYRIQEAGAGGASTGAAGSQIIMLRSTNAEALAKVLQPYAGNGAHIVADPQTNSIIVSADPTQRDALVAMIHAFDIDTLAGQSFALLPVDSGDAKDFATSLEKSLSADQGKPLANVIRVVPMNRINAVLVVTPTDRLMGDVRRIYGMVLQQRRQTVRAWHVYYLQNGRSNDVAYVLQQAFTPDHVTAQPTQQNQIQQLGQTQSALGGGGGLGGAGSGLGGIGGGLGANSGGIGGSITGGGAFGQTANSGVTGGTPTQGTAAGQNPLLGGLDQGGTGEGGSNKDEMRIIAADQNNAILIYGTPQELETVEATLTKIDIVPLQVRIDATIAEVDLNNALEYGTQFFFRTAGATQQVTNGIGSITQTGVSNTNAGTTQPGGILSQAFTAGTTGLTGGGFAGFLLAGGNSQQAALDLLQSVSKVRVLSSPELVVLDNQPARLQVGNQVPVLSQQQQSTLVASASLVNSVSYVPTGVLLQITPRVNNDGQVTLDIAEDVSQSQGILNATGPQSPTFQDRNVQSRVVVQDGQTIGLAGLISDTDTEQNQGVPFLRNIPILGAALGQQQNQRQRTELLVMITPHVERDAHDARAITQDMEEQMPFAAAVPAGLQGKPVEGSSDPQARILQGIGLRP